ncbi:PREDICTED: uncharacterized protein LOC109302207 [Gavialis gangeticus]|uniref:uncharacterized protein LOC109302207 n=1 Tax=Gavialis gangeticus TaxID=94835 RepID=UPI00092F7DEC|nr:PREDICTED: uncharacterized protein LOC109302207 [Gavialis gangeticus]
MSYYLSRDSQLVLCLEIITFTLEWEDILQLHRAENNSFFQGRLRVLKAVTPLKPQLSLKSFRYSRLHYEPASNEGYSNEALTKQRGPGSQKVQLFSDTFIEEEYLLPVLQREKKTPEQRSTASYTQKALTSDMEDNTGMKESADATKKFIHIQTLRAGDIFGLVNVVFEDTLSMTLVSDGAECIVVSKEFFKKHMTEDYRQKLCTSQWTPQITGYWRFIFLRQMYKVHIFFLDSIAYDPVLSLQCAYCEGTTEVEQDSVLMFPGRKPKCLFAGANDDDLEVTPSAADILALLLIGLHQFFIEAPVEEVVLDWVLESFNADLSSALLLLQESHGSQFGSDITKQMSP